MHRALVPILVFLLAPGAQAQRITDARAAVGRSEGHVSQLSPASLSNADMSRENKIGLWALGGAVVGFAVGAILGSRTAECEDFCLVPRRVQIYWYSILGAAAGGLLGAFMGGIVNRGP